MWNHFQMHSFKYERSFKRSSAVRYGSGFLNRSIRLSEYDSIIIFRRLQGYMHPANHRCRKNKVHLQRVHSQHQICMVQSQKRSRGRWTQTLFPVICSFTTGPAASLGHGRRFDSRQGYHELPLSSMRHNYLERPLSYFVRYYRADCSLRGILDPTLPKPI
jgi:hypothetical protein